MSLDRAALKERWKAARDHGLSPEDAARLQAQIDAASFPPLGTVNGLSVSDCPTARFCEPRFVASQQLPADLCSACVRGTGDTAHLSVVFVDPEELHFRTFENIIPLDRLFPVGRLSLEGRRRLGQRDLYRFRLQADPKTQARLSSLDGLGLYLPPMSAVSRGGERFVFHSARLAAALTEAVRSAMPVRAVKGFSHVNPVFRCNRFTAGDAPFAPHMDSPYHDGARNHVSRYTLLLYLTGGQGEPALEVDGFAIHALGAMECVVFDQRYPHQGGTFQDGDKVFLRTELIFTVPDLAEAPKEPWIGALFSKACYLTGEGLREPALARYSSDCYNRVAAAHWEGLSEEDDEAPAPYLHKQFAGVHFIANGYDLWFREEDLSPEEAAAIAVMDYFNAAIDGEAFRKRCRQVATRWERDTDWIPAYLRAEASAPEEPALVPMAPDWLLPMPERGYEDDPIDPVVWLNPDAHEAPPSGVPQRYAREALATAQQFVRERLDKAPILLMGQSLFLNPARFVVEANKIHVLSRERLAPLNFANFWSPRDALIVEHTIDTLQPLVPPILFERRGGCLHLMMDFFQNTWSVSLRKSTLPVPTLSHSKWVRGWWGPVLRETIPDTEDRRPLEWF